jgi:hypothetical protein
MSVGASLDREEWKDSIPRPAFSAFSPAVVPRSTTLYAQAQMGKIRAVEPPPTPPSSTANLVSPSGWALVASPAHPR